MGRRLLAGLALLLAALLLAGPARAQDFTPVWWIDELRGGLYLHSVDNAGPGSNPLFGVIDTTRGVDVNAEVLFSPFDVGPLAFLGEFRPHVGATISTNGLESMVYAGLSWTFHPFDGPVFVEGTFGGALHNGVASGAVSPARNLGCPLLFRESASLGVAVTDNLRVMATIEHASHGGLCSGMPNEGLTNLGVRVGYKF